MLAAIGSAWGLFFSGYAFLAAAAAVRHRVSRLLVPVVCLLPLGYLYADPEAPSLPWGAVSFSILALAWVLSGRWNACASLASSRSLRPAIFLVLWSVVSLIANQTWDTGVHAIVKLLLGLSAFFILEAEGPHLRRVLPWLSVAGAFIAFDLVAHDVLGIAGHGSVGRIGHQRPCVNIVANVEAMLLAAWLPFLPSLQGVRRAGVLALLGLGAAAILASASRQAAISAVLILVLWTLRRPGARRWVALLLGAGVLALVLGASTFSLTQRFEALIASSRDGGSEDGSARFRRIAMGIGVDMFLDHPWIGVGPGAYARESYWYAPPSLLAWRGLTSGAELLYTSPHCLYLRAADEVGLPGVLLLAVLLGSLAWRAAARFRRLDPEGEAIGFTLILVPLYLSTLLSDWQFHSPVMWGFLGMASAALRGAERPSGVST